MSYLDRIQACNNLDVDSTIDWHIDRRCYGRVDQRFAQCLLRFSETFQFDGYVLSLAHCLSNYASRTAAVHEVMHCLHEEGVIDTWVSEFYPVTLAFEARPVMELERAAASFMGIRSFGVHVNGLVKKGRDTYVWVGTRALDKPFWPGRLDQMVAGGQPVGLSLLDNVVKEAEEEAGVPAYLAAQAKQVARLCYQYQSTRGLEDSTLFVYDMWLPESFMPNNTDGEVASFQLISLAELAELTEHTEQFKDNCNLVNIDLLLRHGLLKPCHPQYSVVCETLYGRKN